ncbi:MAG: hypothetical protein ABI347_03395 [Nitrososphaera sp.]|jgi:hypothetical protein
MPLDGDIKDTVRGAIEGDLQAPKVPRERLPKLKKVWRCDSASDFLYGNRAGYYAGLVEGLMMERHKRVLTAEETEEAFQLVEPYLKQLRKYFSHYKARTKK